MKSPVRFVPYGLDFKVFGFLRRSSESVRWQHCSGSQRKDLDRIARSKKSPTGHVLGWIFKTSQVPLTCANKV